MGNLNLDACIELGFKCLKGSICTYSMNPDFGLNISFSVVEKYAGWLET